MEATEVFYFLPNLVLTHTNLIINIKINLTLTKEYDIIFITFINIL